MLQRRGAGRPGGPGMTPPAPTPEEEKLPWQIASIINDAWVCDDDQDPIAVAGHRIAELMLAREATAHARGRAEGLEAALEAIRRRILRDDPEDVKAEIASGRTINDVYMIAKAALTEPTSPK